MTGGREDMLRAVRRALGRDALAREETAVLEERLLKHPRGPVPARADLPPDERTALFADKAGEAAATIERVAAMTDVPGAVAGYLREKNLSFALRTGDDPVLAGLPWADEPLIERRTGRAEESDQVSLSRAFLGVAETGTLVLLSGPASPTTQNFLPDHHLVVLERERIVGAYEDAWDLIREHAGKEGLPRTVNLITGPSRTADIEQTIQLGAHGPRRLHILVVDPR